MDFKKYYNYYVGLSPLKKEELIDGLFKELFQEGEIEIWYEETKNKTREISEQREDEIFEELSPTVYVTIDSLGFYRTFLVKGD